MHKTFQEFLTERGEDASHLFFEAGMYNTEEKLSRIVKLLNDAGVTFEVIGGIAVNAHLGHPAFVTRDVDLLVSRADLAKIMDAAQAGGYDAKKIVGGFALLLPQQDIRDAIHLIFAGEKSHSQQPVPHPSLRPETRDFLGVSIPLAPLADLVAMKLNAFRLKDRLHLQLLDEAGMIAQVESTLPERLGDRLAEARREFAREEGSL